MIDISPLLTYGSVSEVVTSVITILTFDGFKEFNPLTNSANTILENYFIKVIIELSEKKLL